ncbi:tRNA-guanine transglycosylase DpdA [Priestia megaterium]|uniref:tRNA-guanine transglycosylase DpdA n=1 Tax=Priestia megaterium TaxID=1404 RepID=UPI002DB99DCB|nr:tRNA-guanine transglycosylase DpdA [Priestia megaterium]MEC1071403.1 tRNA-guanine transglycosylase DpdA [Priestia megaterium]
MTQNTVRTLIITSCTGEKKFKPENELVQRDFESNEILSNREKELEEYSTNACDLYTGMQHLRLMEGIELIRDKYGNDIVDLSIISAGYGLISEKKKIVPYEVTFNNMNSEEIKNWSSHLQIPYSIQKEISKYDLIIFLLGDKYIRSLQLPLEGTNENQKLVFLASKTSKKFIPSIKPYYFLEVGQNDAKEFSYGLVGLKGYLFKLLSEEIIAEGKEMLNKIYENPTLIMDVLNKYRIKKDNNVQLSLFNEKVVKDKTSVIKRQAKKKEDNQLSQVEVTIPSSQYAKNYGFHDLKFFMPENDDRVDPKFNFITEEHTKDRNPIVDDVYAHQLYNKPNYDGVLISKVNIDQSKNRRDQILEAGGLHKFLRLPSDTPLYGDCGAFSYFKEEKPPYETDEILEYYKQMGFDIGTSIDHLIIGKIAENEAIRNFRYELTLKNAYDFIKRHKEGNYQFTPSGIAQGWDVESYRNSVLELIKMGYKHISIGGLAPVQSDKILEILKGIAPIIPEHMEVHLLGAARLDYLDIFHKLGVTSFDSTAFLKKAWGGVGGGNYFTLDKKKYAAIRIPQADIKKNARIKALVNRGINNIEELKKLEQKALKIVREFDKENTNINNTIETLLKYDSYFETLKSHTQQQKEAKKKRDKYTYEKLDISEEKLALMHKNLDKAIKEVAKKKGLIGIDQFMVGDLSYNSLFVRNENLLKESVDELIFSQMNTIATLEIEAIKAKNLLVLETNLKDFFTENYDDILSTNKLRPLYYELLTDQPWKKCPCSICKNVGVEVIIFRGNNRNRRRGFHNTFVFYNQLKEIVK